MGLIQGRMRAIVCIVWCGDLKRGVTMAGVCFVAAVIILILADLSGLSKSSVELLRCLCCCSSWVSNLDSHSKS